MKKDAFTKKQGYSRDGYKDSWLWNKEENEKRRWKLMAEANNKINNQNLTWKEMKSLYRQVRTDK